MFYTKNEGFYPGAALRDVFDTPAYADGTARVRLHSLGQLGRRAQELLRVLHEPVEDELDSRRLSAC